MKDKDGTIETLERQLVQAGIRSKVQDAEVEINKKKESVKTDLEKHRLQTEAETKFAGKVIQDNVNITRKALQEEAKNQGRKNQIELDHIIAQAQLAAKEAEAEAQLKAKEASGKKE